MHLKVIQFLLCLSIVTGSVGAVLQPRARGAHGQLARYGNATVSSSSKATGNSASSTYTFDAQSHRNVAVYYGKTALSLDSSQNLTAQCADPNVDIVILGFLLNVLGPGNLPTMAINNTAGEMCEDPNATMLAAGATGLKRCATLQSHIQNCQGLGKKVFISVGGAKGTQTFASKAQAEQAAGVLWDLFGSGNGLDAGLRPFGAGLTLDGFDIDNETGDGSYYPDFAARLRNLINSQGVKRYYLSAAPACYYPNPGAPLEMLTQMDFVWPQFYGAPSCNIGTGNFPASFAAWSARLDAGNKPKLFIGGAAWANATSNGGYVPPQQLNQTILSSVKAVGKGRFGGVMLWDAAYGHTTMDPVTGLDIIGVAKGSLLMSAAKGKKPRAFLPIVAAVLGWEFLA
ncbi:glycoside hydrolase [Coniochaeta sp. PMI_546]|nr:glycoside hydrolase [Coniochaeta sp. PMI_546]